MKVDDERIRIIVTVSGDGLGDENGDSEGCVV